MRDQDFILDAIEDSHRNPEITIYMLLCLLDRREVVAAVRRLRDGYGLRVVK